MLKEKDFGSGKQIFLTANSGTATQKLQELHPKISSFWRSSDSPRSDKPKTVYALSHNLNKETIKNRKKILSFQPPRIQWACQIILQIRMQV